LWDWCVGSCGVRSLYFRGFAVFGKDGGGVAVHFYDSFVEPDNAIGDALDDMKVVGDEEDGLTLCLQVGDEAVAFVLKRFVTNREDFIHQENIRVGVNGNSETESEFRAVIPRTQVGINFLFQFRELNDLRNARANLFLTHTKDGGEELDVFQAGEVVVKSRTEFKKCGDAGAFTLFVDKANSAGSRDIDVGENAEQGGFAGTVSPDDRDGLSMRDRKGNIVQYDERVYVVTFAALPEEGLFQCLHVADLEAFRQVLDVNSVGFDIG
jgi:hypothetical protein